MFEQPEDREAEAAAAEAAAIGGPDPAPDLDPEMRPVYEGGGGEAEGFELAEQDLIRNATHDDGGGEPISDAFGAEEERSTAVYGEPDEVDPTEVTRDPSEPDDDPGQGPGLAADR